MSNPNERANWECRALSQQLAQSRQREGELKQERNQLRAEKESLRKIYEISLQERVRLAADLKTAREALGRVAFDGCIFSPDEINGYENCLDFQINKKTWPLKEQGPCLACAANQALAQITSPTRTDS